MTAPSLGIDQVVYQTSDSAHYPLFLRTVTVEVSFRPQATLVPYDIPVLESELS